VHKVFCEGAVNWRSGKKLNAGAKVVEALFDELGATTRNAWFQGNTIAFFEVFDIGANSGNLTGSLVAENEGVTDNVRSDTSFYVIVNI
jgi:hypothetical protein